MGGLSMGKPGWMLTYITLTLVLCGHKISMCKLCRLNDSILFRPDISESAVSLRLIEAHLADASPAHSKSFFFSTA